MKSSKNVTALNVHKAIATSAEGYPLLGYSVIWSAEGVRDRYASFVGKLNSLGIPDDIATVVRPKSALVKAMREETKGRTDTFHKGVDENADRAGWVIAGTHAIDKANLDVEFATQTKVIFNKDTKRAEFQGVNAQALEQKFEQFKDVYGPDNFTNAVLRYIERYCDALSLRKKGGVYFIPAHKQAEFEKLQKLFELFPTAHLQAFPIINTAQAKKEAYRAMTVDVQAEIATLKKEMEAGGQTERSIEIRLEKFRKLKNKVSNYEDLLTGTADGLKSEIETLAATMRAQLEK